MDINRFITKTISWVSTLKLRFFMSLRNKKGVNLINEKITEGGPGIHYHDFDIDCNAMIVIENTRKSEFDIPFNKKNLYLTERTKFKYLNGMKKMREKINSRFNEFFVTNEVGILTIRNNIKDEYILIEDLYTGSLLMEPIILTDDISSIPGLKLTMNISENYAFLSMEDFDFLIHIMERVDLFLYSQSLLNFIANKSTNGVKYQEKKKLFEFRGDSNSLTRFNNQE